MGAASTSSAGKGSVPSTSARRVQPDGWWNIKQEAYTDDDTESRRRAGARRTSQPRRLGDAQASAVREDLEHDDNSHGRGMAAAGNMAGSRPRPLLRAVAWPLQTQPMAGASAPLPSRPSPSLPHSVPLPDTRIRGAAAIDTHPPTMPSTELSRLRSPGIQNISAGWTAPHWWGRNTTRRILHRPDGSRQRSRGGAGHGHRHRRGRKVR